MTSLCTPWPSSDATMSAKQRELRARIHVDAELDVELRRVDAERDRREHDGARTALPSARPGADRDLLCLDVVGRVRQVVVVRLGGAPRQNGDRVRRRINLLPGALGEDVWAVCRHFVRASQAGAPADADRNPRSTDRRRRTRDEEKEAVSTTLSPMLLMGNNERKNVHLKVGDRHLAGREERRATSPSR